MSETILPSNKMDEQVEPYLNTRNFKHICSIQTERRRQKRGWNRKAVKSIVHITP
jgi:hypothetical protein